MSNSDAKNLHVQMYKCSTVHRASGYIFRWRTSKRIKGGMRILYFSAAGLPDWHADLRGSAKVPAAHGDIDADGRNRALHGRPESDGPLDDAVEHHAGRQHHEYHVDERHEYGRLPGHGFHGDVHLARELPQRPRAGRVPFLVTLGPKHPEQEEPGEDLNIGIGDARYRLNKVLEWLVAGNAWIVNEISSPKADEMFIGIRISSILRRTKLRHGKSYRIDIVERYRCRAYLNKKMSLLQR